MSKRVAVIAVNPVNGMGLFQYLESFYENKIDFKVFAVAQGTEIQTNSGIKLKVDDTIANLKGRADEFDALVFSCGDAIPTFKQHISESYNRIMIDVIKEFGEKDKLMIGHCAAGLMFEIANITAGKRLAVHQLVKSVIKKGIATDDPFVIDGNFYTAQCEHTIPSLIPHLIKALS